MYQISEFECGFESMYIKAYSEFFSEILMKSEVFFTSQSFEDVNDC